MTEGGKKYRVLGLMSGSSLDGLDIACSDFYQDNGRWKFDLIHSETVSYTNEFRSRLRASVEMSALDLLLLHNAFGRYAGELAGNFLSKNELSVDFIASHGHTAYHQPDKGLTFQLGAGQELANASRQKVICDFRSQDVSLGGHGAPLAPIGDERLFDEYDFCLNIGGIANASFRYNGQRIAFDISPANMLLNHILLPTGLLFDDRGRMAGNGKMDRRLLDRLNAFEFYARPFPKSLSYEWFCKHIVPVIDADSVAVEDQLCTAVHHIAQQISESLLPYARNGDTMMITGGGAKNDFLIETLRQYLNGRVTVILPDDSIIHFKEALIFAFMGVLRSKNEINCLNTVTGARFPSSSGVFYWPDIP